MIAEDRVVPAFEVQIGIIPDAEQSMDYLRPVRLAEPGEAMLGDARMAEAIDFEQLSVDKSILRVHMENARAKLVDVRNRIDELAEQVAGVPLQAEIIAFCFVEQPFPHRGLGE